MRRPALSGAAVVVGIFVVVVGVTLGVFKVYETAAQAHDAICALRAERVRNVEATQQFLEAHPDGTPDISVDDLNRSIKLQQETIRAFRFAKC